MDERSQYWYRLHRRYLTPIKTLFMFTYIFVLPFLEAPGWCIKRQKAEPDWSRTGFRSLSCHNYDIPYSGLPTMSPICIATIELMCLAFIGFFRWSKSKWGTIRKVDWWRNLAFAIVIAIIVIDNIYSIVKYTRPFISNIMRPIVFGTFLHLVRSNFN